MVLPYTINDLPVSVPIKSQLASIMVTIQLRLRPPFENQKAYSAETETLHQINQFRATALCSFVRLLLWAEVQPTLDLSAETS